MSNAIYWVIYWEPQDYRDETPEFLPEELKQQVRAWRTSTQGKDALQTVVKTERNDPSVYDVRRLVESQLFSADDYRGM